ncbi:MAG: anhydro-N-acetylmuramic acid kinase [Planctomycetia bacterium]|nr:anhydro-N-acetylmuramic acid kinase [Planctomycetia bacterium]
MAAMFSVFRRSHHPTSEAEPEIPIAGIAFDDHCRAVRAAIMTTSGSGSGLKWALRGAVAMTTTPEIVDTFHRLRSSTAIAPIRQTLHRSEWLARQLAGFADAALRRLLQRVSIPVERLLATGLTEPGLRGSMEEDPGSAVEADEPPRIHFQRNLANTALLAEMSGVPVIDDFAARDLAVDGRGEPLEPLAWWTLFHHELRNRLLIDLYPDIVRYTWLPKPRSIRVHQSVLSGTMSRSADLSLTLERLHRELRTSLSADLAIEEIFSETVIGEEPESSSPGTSPEVFPSSPPGIQELGNVFPGVPVYPLRILGIPAELRPACVASLLARFFLDRVPASFPSLTGGTAPRILGRLTPGNAAATERLLRFMNGEPLVARSLRSSVSG